MLKKEERPVRGTGCPDKKPTIWILSFIIYKLFLTFPTNTKGRVGDQVVEFFSRKSIFWKWRTQFDVVGVFTRNQQVGFTDRIGLWIQFLTVYDDVNFRIDVLQNPFFSNGQQTTGSTQRIKQRPDFTKWRTFSVRERGYEQI